MAMTSTLPPFTPLATCSKCGHGEIRTIFREDGRHHGCPTATRLRTNQVGEHLERCCERCRYVWDERTADTPAVE